MKEILLVFDLDGTLVDSKNDITTAVNLTMLSYGLDQVPIEEVASFVGTGVGPLIIERTREVASAEDAMDKFSQYYLEHLADETLLYPGMAEVLAHYLSVKKVILTNKSNKFLGPLIKVLNIDKLFVGFYGRESFATRKPDPGPLKSISKIHGVALENIVMIGDTHVDMAAGKSAGTQTCAVTFGYGDDLKSLAPTFLVDKVEELIGLFK